MSIIPKCIFCKYYNGSEDDCDYAVTHVCSAFPDGITDEIFFSEVPHDKSYKGDHRIQFEPKPEKAYEVFKPQFEGGSKS